MNFRTETSWNSLIRHNLILFNKPYGVVSQFSGDHPNLSDFIDEPGFYAAGRLDKDSEGLLLLTNDGRLQARISQPGFKMKKTYWVQVEGDLNQDAIEQLERGVELKDGLTRPAQARLIAVPVPKREPDIRHRESIGTSWLELIIQEGKNRQVRRMTSALSFPTLRLFRAAIGPWEIGELAPGEHQLTQVNLPKT